MSIHSATGKTYEWSPSQYATNASFVPKLGASILQTLGPKAGERILDLGCGDGVLTREISRSRATVIGIDSSTKMIQKSLKEDPQGQYFVMDGHELVSSPWAEVPESEKFDAVFSNAALHWMKESPSQVVAGIRKVLKSNGQGRFVAEFGGFLNIATVHAALINELKRRNIDGKQVSPWFFPKAEEYREILEAQGFKSIDIAHVARATELGELGLRGWLDTFAMPFMDALPNDEEREAVKYAVEEQLAPVLRDARGAWTLDYWRIRVSAATA
ncbi:hypothetical protein HDU84_004814 [Entophlyctis sp. JEL0112]|nr:hypothetical protein HDU84_004814 [Entophlyctis sp. JEL0112]